MMPAGRYYVGDLCYVMHPQWEEFCSITIDNYACHDGEFNLANGIRFATYSTEYGDGVYEDQHENSYPVDAGLIGCIRLEDIQDPKAWMDGGNVIEFIEPFNTRYDNGTIVIGHVSIDTKGCWEDDSKDEESE